MTITHEVFMAASRRATATRATFPTVHAIRYDPGGKRVILSLTSGLELSFPPSLAQGLENARPVDLQGATISPSGLGIHFPRLDADLYLPTLLEGILGSRRWMAARTGKLGGQSCSIAKAHAARENGKRGGRPKKSSRSA